jgi:hypothetical protein
MVDIKEIKHIRAAPFTLMTSSIHAILAFIAAIIIVLFFGTIAALIPAASLFAAFIALLGIGIIILWPLTAFLIQIVYAFVGALLYNLFAPKVGGIKLGIDGEELKSIPVVSVALIISCIAAIGTLIYGLYMGLAGSTILSLISGIIPIAGTVVANATNTTGATIPTGAFVGTMSGFWAINYIIINPIMSFIGTFIGVAIFAVLYNLIIPKIGGIKLIFAEAGTAFELTNIPVVPAALAIGTISAILGAIIGLIFGLLLMDILLAITMLIIMAIMMFIIDFIIVALGTLIYNFLQPKIGGIKLVLE